MALRITDAINQRDLLLRNGQPPPIPSPRSNWIDQTISEDLFWRRIKKRDTCAPKRSDNSYHFIEPEPDPTKREVIAANSVLRFRNERKVLPLSHTQFAFPRQSIPGWAEWARHIYEDLEHKDALRSAKVYRAIDITTQFGFPATDDMKLWRAVVSRWSTQTHTFIASWGEFTPTLEDVYMLLRLHEFGRTDITTLSATQEEQDIQAALVAKLKASKVRAKKSIFTSWIEHFSHDKDEDRAIVSRPRPELM